MFKIPRLVNPAPFCALVMLAYCGRVWAQPSLSVSETSRIVLEGGAYVRIALSPNSDRAYVATSGEKRTLWRIATDGSVDKSLPLVDTLQVRGISRFGVFNDSVYVLDRNARRVQFYDFQLRPLQSYISYGEIGPGLTPIDVFFDGSVLATPTITASVSTRTQDPVPLLRVGTSGRILDTLGWTSGGLSVSRLHYGDMEITARLGLLHQYLDNAPIFVPTTDRRFVVIVTRPDATSGEIPAYEVTLISALGDTAWSRRFQYTPVVVDSSDSESLLKQQAALLGPPFVSIGDGRKALVRLNLPKHWPAIQQVVSGADGTLWLRVHSSTRHQRWNVLSPQGGSLYSVTLPKDLELFAVKGGRLVAVSRSAKRTEVVFLAISKK